MPPGRESNDLCWVLQFLPGKDATHGLFYFQLNFVGVTVKLEQKYVHFTSTSHQFIPVPIGDTLPPRQVSALCCPGHQEA